jgi:hypothetical protein
MSFWIIGGVIFFVFILISQFGGLVAARKSGPWWLVISFLLFSSIYPEFLNPISHFLGIQIASNFFFSVMILFLVFQLLQEAASNTRLGRNIQQLTSRIAIQSLLTRPEVQSKMANKSVIIGVPCFNEEESLPQILQNVDKVASENPDIIFLFVDDGSKDSTFQKLLKGCESKHIIATQHSINIGVSGVLKTIFGFSKAFNVNYVIQFDGDGQHPMQAIQPLLQNARREQTDLLIGSRFCNTGTNTKDISTTKYRIFGIQLISFFLSFFTRNRIADPTSGFRVYSKQAIERLEHELPDEFPEPESIALLATKNLKIKEFKVQMNPRTQGVSSLAGLKSLRFMLKVLSALLGLRLRTLLK